MTSIADLGIIGNCRSAALVSREASIVWCSLPDFDSPSVFASLLDEKKGGEFQIVPEEGSTVRQEYLDRTNILKTTLIQPSGILEIYDFMPRYLTESGQYYQAPEIYRLVRAVSGSPFLRVKYDPRLDYARNPTVSDIGSAFIKSHTTKGDYHSIYLYSDLPYESIRNGESIPIESHCFFLVSYHQKLVRMNFERAELELERTRVYWLNWVNRTPEFPRYQKEIIRSALTLKLLTYQKTGAVIAAVTTSLPETPGETRNWDYRFCWIRDASMIIQTLTAIHHRKTARNFLRFLLNTMTDKAETLQILYGIRGEKTLTEAALNHLSGYQNSRPVRIGNAAFSQKQNDIYGVLADLIHTSFIHFPTTLNESEELWTTVRAIMKFVEDGWKKPDRGIWEIRNEEKHFVFSKVLSWVAADRCVKIAELLGRKDVITDWTLLRDTIRKDIEIYGWNEKANAYTQFYGSSELDASVLLMEKYGFCDAHDPRYVSTVKAVYQGLSKNGLMFRYKNRDDFGAPRSSFTICTFWMIESLYKIGETATAERMFNDLTASANPLGLFSEDMDFETRELYGNFPQGYSHLALIQTAILLNGGEPVEKAFRWIGP